MIYKALVGIVLNGFALYAVTLVVKDVTYTGDIKFFIVGGLLLGMLNTFLKPLMKILAFPFVLLTGGLFLVVVNGLMVWFLDYFIDVVAFRDVSLTVATTTAYVIAGLVIGVINWAENILLK